MVGKAQFAPLTSLPFTEEEVDVLTMDALAELVLQVKEQGDRLQDKAPVQVNAFLAYAAVRLAKEYHEKIIQGEGYYVPAANF